MVSTGADPDCLAEPKAELKAELIAENELGRGEGAGGGEAPAADQEEERRTTAEICNVWLRV